MLLRGQPEGSRCSGRLTLVVSGTRIRGSTQGFLGSRRDPIHSRLAPLLDRQLVNNIPLRPVNNRPAFEVVPRAGLAMFVPTLCAA